MHVHETKFSHLHIKTHNTFRTEISVKNIQGILYCVSLVNIGYTVREFIEVSKPSSEPSSEPSSGVPPFIHHLLLMLYFTLVYTVESMQDTGSLEFEHEILVDASLAYEIARQNERQSRIYFFVKGNDENTCVGTTLQNV